MHKLSTIMGLHAAVLLQVQLHFKLYISNKKFATKCNNLLSKEKPLF